MLTGTPARRDVGFHTPKVSRIVGTVSALLLGHVRLDAQRAIARRTCICKVVNHAVDRIAGSDECLV